MASSDKTTSSTSPSRGFVAGFSLQPMSVIRLLALLRTLAAGLLLAATLALVCEAFSIPPWVWGLPLVLAAFNLWLHRAARSGQRVSAGQALVGHLMLDTLILFAFFWAVGGATNPFVSLFLLPVAFAGATLDLRGAAVVTLLSIACYTGLLWRYLSRLTDPLLIAGFERHVIGMWITFVLAALLLCAFLFALAARVRESERALANAREQTMREESVVAMATVAAGAAHAVNTPLSSILVAAESWVDDPALPMAAREDMATIRDQAEVAADALRALVAARDPRSQPVAELAAYLDEVLSRWRIRRPEIELDVSAWQALAERRVRQDPALAQALHNLLDNAADAALETIEPRLALARNDDAGQLDLIIDDPGRDAVERLRRATEGDSTKPDGLGIGLTLARASLSRLGGHLIFETGPTGGTRTRIRLPLAALAPAAR